MVSKMKFYFNKFVLHLFYFNNNNNVINLNPLLHSKIENFLFIIMFIYSQNIKNHINYVNIDLIFFFKIFLVNFLSSRGDNASCLLQINKGR